MDCSVNQYYYRGECHICQQCGPGQELSEVCGYGSGADAYCTSCSVRSYKEDWGHQSCKICQSCKLVNRHQKVPCTSNSNAVCGDCIPGFYSKTRIDGLHDLECMACGPSSANERQCTQSRTEGVVKVWSSQAPPQDSAAATAICGALVAVAIAVSVLLFVCCRRTLLRKMFEGCAGSKNGSRSERDQATATTGSRETVVLNLEKEVKISSAAVDSPASLKSCLKACPFSGSAVTTSELPPCYPSCSSETQPLMRSSTCSNRSLGRVSQMSSSSANSGEYVAESPPDPLFDDAVYCASDRRERRQHAPVECTELDIHGPVVPDGNGAGVRMKASTGVTGGSEGNVSVERLNSPSAGLAHSNDSCLNGDQQFCSNGVRRGNKASNVLSLVKRSCVLMQGVHLGKLPQSLVESLALKLDPVFPGVKNYQQVALELGISLEVLQSLRGFEHVFYYLTSCTLHTVPDLLTTFHHLQRIDTLLLLCEYAAKSQPTACQLPTPPKLTLPGGLQSDVQVT